jgi:hypothetical protein
MAVMSKDRRSAKKPSPPAEPVLRPRARATGEVANLGVEVDPRIALAIEQYKHAHGASKRFIVEAALKEWLDGKGFWPPKPEEEQQPEDKP